MAEISRKDLDWMLHIIIQHWFKKMLNEVEALIISDKRIISWSQWVWIGSQLPVLCEEFPFGAISQIRIIFPFL